jgi:hypothetical protein
MGEIAGSEVVRFGCEGSGVEVVVIRVVLGSELGGERLGTGDLDLDRERVWKMESDVDDRESDRPWKGNGKE